MLLTKKLSKKIFLTSSPAQTAELAGVFASCLRGGEIICLYGPIGSGKTVFVQGLSEALGAKERPVSASFGLMRSYAGRLKLRHFDLFRLEPKELGNLGMEDFLAEKKTVIAVEWAGPARDFLPYDRLEINLGLGGGDRRNIRVSCSGPQSAKLLKKALSIYSKKRAIGNEN
ncbi:MAG: tRNA (adenosine(37)-N6)-threonylcarbamoyltransferase complex ATPase subunit type 1 TsaE [bacterium]